MIRVNPFSPTDLAGVAVQTGQAEFAALNDAERIRRGATLAAGGPCFTVREVATGAVLFAGGLTETHPHYGTLWSVFAKDAGRMMAAIHRRARTFLSMQTHRRIDAVVRADHEAGHRWMLMLGFCPEAHLAAWFADGTGAVIYRSTGWPS